MRECRCRKEHISFLRVNRPDREEEEINFMSPSGTMYALSPERSKARNLADC
jgi:hypothetical protein